MKRLLILIAVLTLPASIGFAHIEETWAQCDARYGKPVHSGEQYAHYKKDGIAIAITFDDLRNPSQDPQDQAARRGMTRHGRGITGKAVEVDYAKDGANAYFSQEEVKALLAANAGTAGRSADGNTWESGRRTHKHEDYLRFDNAVRARVYWEYIGGVNVAKRVEVKLVGPSDATRPQQSGDQLDAIGKDF